MTAQSQSVSKLLDAKKTKDYYSFKQWLAFLDHAALTAGFNLRISKDTGDECWREYYEDGYTPFDALEDFANAL